MNNYGFFPADILLPEKDFEKWAVVACDQFTSEQEYWDNAEKTVGDCPSALRIVLPEIYLGADTEKRVEAINGTMQKYLENGVLKEYKQSMIYVERIQSDGLIRRGIVGAVCLSDYDYKSGTDAKIRATEQTVLERIPPRVAIRREAPLELPHVLLLADDPQMTVIEPIAAKKDTLKKVYDFDLMLGGGHITGWLLGSDEIEQVGKAVELLTDSRKDKMMFAVGDGNHSLATAKECSKLNKSQESKSALVEVVNIHDTAIKFEPIYRVLFGVDPETVIADLVKDLGENSAKTHKYTCVFGDTEREITLKATAKLPVGTLQVWLDKYIADKNIKIDYIHGIESVQKLCKQDNTLGFLFDGMQKNELFDAVSKDGSLPRKTFSMGHAEDKRYYIEARKIK